MTYPLMKYKTKAQLLNNRVFTDYFWNLALITRALFKWEGLPNNLDEKWIERMLFTEGACIFYEDPNLGYMVAKIADNGPLNCYDEPTNVTPIAPNYIYDGPQLVNSKNVVIIRNNDDMLPSAPMIELYAWKLTNIERAIQVNVHQQKTPLIVKCSDKQKLSLRQVIAQRDENELTIYGDKSLDTSGIEVLNTTAPIVFDKLETQKHMVYNECMTRLGINNANMDKRERLVDDEVQANNQQVQASEDVMLKARQRACEELNKVFGLNISVKRRTPPTSAFMAELGASNEKEEE